jgi:hypothetical protein
MGRRSFVSEFQWSQLQEAEMPFSNRVSFEKVMEMREKKKKRRALIWWFSSAGLLLVGLGSLYIMGPNASSRASSQVAVNPPVSSSKPSEIAATSKPHSTSVDAYITQSERATAKSPAKINTERNVAKSNQRSEKPLLEKPVEAPTDRDAPWLKERAAATNSGIANSGEKDNRDAIAFGSEGSALRGREDMGSRVYSMGLTPSYAEWLDPFALQYEYFDDRLLPDNDLSKRFKPSLYAEFTAFTGSHNAINFDNRDNLSVLGTQYHAHYQMAILKDLGNGHLAGMGLAYGEWVGNGQYRNRTLETFTQIDTFQVVVMIPGYPVQTVDVIDTNTFSEWSETTGTLNYKISKISIPLAYRKYLPLGKTVWRLSAQLSPGMTTRTEGSYFSRSEYLPLSVQRQFTFDGRLAFGPSVPISNMWTIMLEPNLFAQSFVEAQSKQAKAKLFSGFGVSLVGKL